MPEGQAGLGHVAITDTARTHHHCVFIAKLSSCLMLAVVKKADHHD